ncbi:MAG: hypothetical protein ABIP95_14305, partial [Pelobium sp.]
EVAHPICWLLFKNLERENNGNDRPRFIFDILDLHNCNIHHDLFIMRKQTHDNERRTADNNASLNDTTFP